MNKPQKSTRTPLSANAPEPTELRFDPITPFCRDVLALFSGPFAEVRFPDLDRDVLEGDASRLLSAQAEVEALEQSLDQARERAREAGHTLTTTASRAVAYARIYVAGQPAAAQLPLERALDAVKQSSDVLKPERTARPRRAKKENATGELLAMSSGETLPAHDSDEGRARDEAAE